MVSDSPPSSRLRPSGDSALERQRGELRDTLSGLKNLDQLLRSLRVGPRALASVLPDVHAACSSLRVSAVQLLEAIGAKLAPDSRAIDSLRAFVLPRIDELETGLAHAITLPMTAKNRLEVERLVSRLSRDLDSARELIDLLEEATSAPAIHVDLLEVLQQAFNVDAGADAPVRLHASLDMPDRSVELLVNPRVVIALFAISAEYVAASDNSVRISLQVASEGRYTLSIVRDRSAGSGARIEPRHAIEPLLVCLESVSRLLGAQCDASKDGEISFSWQC
jgi:hypothetical protein